MSYILYRNDLLIKDIYAHMQDEESELIFQHMLLYFLDYNIEHKWDMLKACYEYDKLKPQSRNSHQNLFSVREKYNDQPVVLYGVGGNAFSIKAFLETIGIKPDAYCDSDPNKWNKYLDKLPIISPNMILERYNDPLIVISSPIYEEEISQSLVQMGISPNKMFFSTFSEKQYFGVPFLKPQKDEIYLDAGPYDGNTIAQFIEFCNSDYKKIYAMEPDTKHYERIRRKVNDNTLPNVMLINSGAWIFNTTLAFENSGTSGSKISKNGSAYASMMAIDSVVEDDNVTLIKMDIEGAELSALKGAEKTIKRCKPKLAICIYHKPEDVIDIPAYILELNPNYKFYIRQHVISVNETVLYAIP